MTFVNCVVLQPTKTIIFPSLDRTILWEHAWLRILFLEPNFHYFWIMLILVHCVVQWKLFFLELSCSQAVASAGHSNARGFPWGYSASWLEMPWGRTAVMQELCLAGTCAEWRSRKKAALSFPVCPCWFPTEHRVAAEGVTAQRPRGGSHGRRRPVPLGQPRAAPLCPQHPRALACCCKCAALTLLYSCP